MAARPKGTTTLAHRWAQLEGIKKPHITMAEEYARWTLPYIFPMLHSENVELQLSKDSIGAQAVNHLSNKVVSILFPSQRLFFRLRVPESMRKMAVQAIEAAGAGGEVGDAAQQVAQASNIVEEQLASAEKEAQDYMDMVQYRPQATNAAKLLIITGNALEFHPDGAPTQVFNLRDYCVQRDLSGEVIELMTRECKAFETFHPDVQAQLRGIQGKREYTDKSDVVIYTQVKLNEDGKYYVKQAGDHCELDTDGVSYTKDELPWIVLTWNLVRGEDYGRGLVGDYSGAFHAINVLSGSLLNIAAIMGDIKFLVNPQSLVDIPTLNAAASGTYHPGKEGDVTAIQLQKQADAQFILMLIERYEKQISAAFLLNSALTRDAERVTAEEIRMQANELETSNGGIYSRLAATWQGPLSKIILRGIQFEGLEGGVEPQVVTGMDSLSRSGELENIMVFLNYLAALNNVPEDVRGRLKMSEFMSIVGSNTQVDYKRFIMGDGEYQQLQQQMMDQQMQIEQMKNQGQVQAAGAKALMTDQGA